MTLIAIAAVMLVCAALPCVVFLSNLKEYVAPPRVETGEEVPYVAVLIPARNEERNLAAVLQSVLASESVMLEVVVYDDASTDRSAGIVREIAGKDIRVRLMEGGPLPAGWNGKQHACWRMAEESRAPVLLFLDADVRLQRDAIARMTAWRRATGSALVSGFPRLVTMTWMEWLVLPLIHFVLLGFLPLQRMRRSTAPELAAGCGQFLLVEREAYFASGGHAEIRSTMHDGLMLPRVMRKAGFRTDLADLTELADVRMYESAGGVWSGLAKNATEGLAAPARIMPVTLLLLLGQVFPVVAAMLCTAMIISIQLVVGADYDHPRQMAVMYAAVFGAAVMSFVPRLIAVRRFRQPWKSALMHPLGVLLLLCVQWYALVRQMMGRPVGWRQRAYAADTRAEVQG